MYVNCTKPAPQCTSIDMGVFFHDDDDDNDNVDDKDDDNNADLGTI